MADAFENYAVGLDSPATHVALITPNDAADLATVTRAISFVTAGALKVTTVGGETEVIPSGALAAGVMHPLRVVKVFETGTAADMGLVGYW